MVFTLLQDLGDDRFLRTWPLLTCSIAIPASAASDAAASRTRSRSVEAKSA
jgi:hypothetical protein